MLSLASVQILGLRSRLTQLLRDRELDERRRFFTGRDGDRYWWHRQTSDRYLPDLYAVLSPAEWTVLREWYEETERTNFIGESAIPMVAWSTSYVSANDISRVVQLGTYAGYSTLLLGWTLRRAGKRKALYAVDIDAKSMAFTRKWIARAGLTEQVETVVADAADPSLVETAREYLGGPPRLVTIDTSHAYENTKRELDLWYGALERGGTLALHGTSRTVAHYDGSGQGGVARAFREWRDANGVESIDVSWAEPILEARQHTYKDGCGLGLVIKNT